MPKPKTRSAATTSAPQAPAWRRWLVVEAVVVVAICAIAIGYAMFTWRTPRADIPQFSLAGIEPSLQAAVEQGRTKVEQNPRDAEAWARLGQALMSCDLADAGARCFETAEQLEPDNPRWPYLQALRHLPDDPAAAAGPMERAVQRCQKSNETCNAIRCRLAESLIQINRTDEAEKLLQAVLARSPKHARAHFHSGLLAASRGDFAAAEEHLRQAASDPQSRRKATMQLAMVLARLDRGEESRQVREQLDRLPPDESWRDPIATEFGAVSDTRYGYEQQVDQLEQQGKMEEAIALRRRIAAKFPDAESHLSLGQLLVRAGRYDDAIDALQASASIDRDRLQTQFLLGAVAFFRAEQLEKSQQSAAARPHWQTAQQHFQEVVRLRSDYGVGNLYLGIARLRLGEAAEALPPLELAAAARPELVEAQVALAEALAALDRQEEAETRLAVAVRLAPGDPRIEAARQRMKRRP